MKKKTHIFVYHQILIETDYVPFSLLCDKKKSKWKIVLFAFAELARSRLQRDGVADNNNNIFNQNKCARVESP